MDIVLAKPWKPLRLCADLGARTFLYLNVKNAFFHFAVDGKNSQYPALTPTHKSQARQAGQSPRNTFRSFCNTTNLEPQHFPLYSASKAVLPVWQKDRETISYRLSLFPHLKGQHVIQAIASLEYDLLSSQYISWLGERSFRPQTKNHIFDLLNALETFQHIDFAPAQNEQE